MSRLVHRDGQWLAPEPGRTPQRVERLHQQLIREKGDSLVFGFIMGWGMGAGFVCLIYTALL